jgi:CRP/FNR family transcriptional regulator, cyclic AMP receptor protein
VFWVNPADELARIPLFGSLSEDDRHEVASWFDPKRAGAGSVLAGEGAAGYSFFVLVDGTATVTIGDDVVGTLGPGDFFGEVALLDGGRRTATVTAASDVELLALFGTEFRRLQQAFPEVASRLDAVVEQRLQARAGS